MIKKIAHNCCKVIKKIKTQFPFLTLREATNHHTDSSKKTKKDGSQQCKPPFLLIK